MTSKQRAYLKSLAAPLEATLQIGKLGLTPEVTQAVREAFNTRELLKITMLKTCLDDIRQTADILSERLSFIRKTGTIRKSNFPDRYGEYDGKKSRYHGRHI